jgi:hypothetical protein
MKLRNHRLAFCDGVRTWPPSWLWRGGDENKHPIGEVGILKEVVASSLKPSNRCYVIMKYEGAEYMGVLRFDSYSFCQRVYDLLLQHCGESIKQIAEIDLEVPPFTGVRRNAEKTPRTV